MRNIKIGDSVMVNGICEDNIAYTDTEGQFEEYSDEWFEYIEEMKTLIGKIGVVTNIERDFIEVTFSDVGEQYLWELDLEVGNA